MRVEVPIGTKFERLTVIGLSPDRKYHVTCRCDCGSVKAVAKSNLTLGITKSCGCLHREKASERRFIHGESRRPNETAEFKAYCCAKERCESQSGRYKTYGNRGIEFRFTSFEQFLAEVGRRPSPKHSLDRKDNDGHYEPGNVKWSTPLEQASHTTRSHYLTIDGIRLHIAEWTRQLRLSKNAVLERLNRGWCERCSVTLPSGNRCAHIMGHQEVAL